MLRWLAWMLCNWHRWKAAKLAEFAKEQRRALERLDERIAQHEHRARHWDLISNRRGK
jgi:hypothetical protein